MGDLMKPGEPLRVSSIILRGCQIKSIEDAREIAKALDVIEKKAGIHSVTISLEDTFICPDINFSNLDDTPMEKVLSGAMKTLKDFNVKTKRQV